MAPSISPDSDTSETVKSWKVTPRRRSSKKSAEQHNYNPQLVKQEVLEESDASSSSSDQGIQCRSFGTTIVKNEPISPPSSPTRTVRHPTPSTESDESTTTDTANITPSRRLKKVKKEWSPEEEMTKKERSSRRESVKMVLTRIAKYESIAPYDIEKLRNERNRQPVPDFTTKNRTVECHFQMVAREDTRTLLREILGEEASKWIVTKFRIQVEKAMMRMKRVQTEALEKAPKGPMEIPGDKPLRAFELHIVLRSLLQQVLHSPRGGTICTAEDYRALGDSLLSLLSSWTPNRKMRSTKMAYKQMSSVSRLEFGFKKEFFDKYELNKDDVLNIIQENINYFLYYYAIDLWRNVVLHRVPIMSPHIVFTQYDPCAELEVTPSPSLSPSQTHDADVWTDYSGGISDESMKTTSAASVSVSPVASVDKPVSPISTIPSVKEPNFISEQLIRLMPITTDWVGSAAIPDDGKPHSWVQILTKKKHWTFWAGAMLGEECCTVLAELGLGIYVKSLMEPIMIATTTEVPTIVADFAKRQRLHDEEYIMQHEIMDLLLEIAAKLNEKFMMESATALCRVLIEGIEQWRNTDNLFKQPVNFVRSCGCGQPTVPLGALARILHPKYEFADQLESAMFTNMMFFQLHYLVDWLKTCTYLVEGYPSRLVIRKDKSAVTETCNSIPLWKKRVKIEAVSPMRPMNTVEENTFVVSPEVRTDECVGDVPSVREAEGQNVNISEEPSDVASVPSKSEEAGRSEEASGRKSLEAENAGTIEEKSITHFEAPNTQTSQILELVSGNQVLKEGVKKDEMNAVEAQDVQTLPEEEDKIEEESNDAPVQKKRRRRNHCWTNVKRRRTSI